jgi:hypothetical protein
MTEEKWRINKSVSVWHMIATVTLLISGFTFIYDLRERVAVSDFKIGAMEQRFERMEDRTNNQFDKIMSHLARLENKMDGYFSDRRGVEQKGG